MLLFRAHTLPSGLRVRVRLPHRGDLAGLLALHDRSGRAVTELEAGRLLHHDPRTRVVVCATAWVDGAETLVGFVAATATDAPVALLADEARAPGVTAVLEAGLHDHLSRVA